jgi:hypothetical protein
VFSARAMINVVVVLVVSATYGQYVRGQNSQRATQPALPTTQTAVADLPPVVIRPWQIMTPEADFLPHARTVTFGVGIDGYSTFSGERDTLLLPSLTAGYYFTKSVSLNFDVGVSDVDYTFGYDGFDGAHSTIHDVGGLLTLRKTLWHNNDVLLSADVGVGAIHADTGFPKDLEQDQIVRTIGLVTDIRIGPAAFLTLSARYARFANDFFDRTPSRGFNGMNYYVGLKILF